MPGENAQRGDIYNAHPDAVLEPDRKTTPRRMVCVAELPHDEYVWKAMARSTTDYDETIDLHSPARDDLGLTLDGWWTYRFLRSVKKRWTGHETLCKFLATLPEPLKTEVLDHYKGRPKPGATKTL